MLIPALSRSKQVAQPFGILASPPASGRSWLEGINESSDRAQRGDRRSQGGRQRPAPASPTRPAPGGSLSGSCAGASSTWSVCPLRGEGTSAPRRCVCRPRGTVAPSPGRGPGGYLVVGRRPPPFIYKVDVEMSGDSPRASCALPWAGECGRPAPGGEGGGSGCEFISLGPQTHRQRMRRPVLVERALGSGRGSGSWSCTFFFPVPPRAPGAAPRAFAERSRGLGGCSRVLPKWPSGFLVLPEYPRGSYAALSGEETLDAAPAGLGCQLWPRQEPRRPGPERPGGSGWRPGPRASPALPSLCALRCCCRREVTLREAGQRLSCVMAPH